MKAKYDKYVLYEKAVQDPEPDVDFLNKTYRRLRGKRPFSLREDFCGTGFLSTTWVKQSVKHSSFGLDLCEEAIGSGKERHYSKLTPEEQKRMRYYKKNVLKSAGMKADVVVAMNFSWWVFKERSHLLEYFKAVRKSMKRDSIFCLDTMGGGEVAEIASETKKLKGFTYYWECKSFNPIDNHVYYYIHFKLNGEKIKRRVFHYDWRLWGLPEVKDILLEAGFSDVRIFWEGDDEKGGGDGNYRETKTAEDCLLWVTYLVALP